MWQGIHRVTLIMAGTLATLALAGCEHASQGNPTADYPMAEQFPQIYQSKLMAAAHWQIIADNEADMLTSRFESVPELAPHFVDEGTPTDFETAYRNFLLAGLIDRGVMVFEDDRGMPVEYDVQVVRFADRDQWNFAPGAVSASTASAFVIARAVEHWSNPAALLIPLAVGADVYNYFNADIGTPNTEIILTTRVKNEGQLVYTHSSIYYLRTEDLALYQNSEEKRVGFGVRGPVTL